MPEEEQVDAAAPEQASIAPDPLVEILRRLKSLEEENASLKEQVAAAAPQHLATDAGNKMTYRANVARSVTIATRPVVENPEQYEHIVNPNDVAQRGGA
jgi:hypothetical protein